MDAQGPLRQTITLRPAPWRMGFWALVSLLVAWMCYDLVTTRHSGANVVLATALGLIFAYLVIGKLSPYIRLESTGLTFVDGTTGAGVPRKVFIPIRQIHAVYVGRPQYVLDVLDGKHDVSARTFATGAVVGMIAPMAAPRILTTRTEPWIAVATGNGRVYAINLRPYTHTAYTALLTCMQALQIPVVLQSDT